jgi:creatinine amidohydrolase
MIKQKSIWMNELKWKDIEAYLKKESIVIVPVGSTEEHGYAAPLGLDTYVAIALAADSAKKAGVLATPPLWFGDSSHHLGFPGTISLKTSTLTSVVEDISRSLAKAGFRKVIFINGHKIANIPAITTAIKNVHETELKDVFFAIIDPAKIAKGIAGKIKEEPEHHAGELETSHIMYKYPELIDKTKLLKKNINFEKVFSPFSQFDLFGSSGEVVDIAWNSDEQRKFAPTGAFSANAKATSGKGKVYHDYMVEIIVEFISWLKTYKGPIGNTKYVKK